MAVYAIGDIQGCALSFEELLEKIDFDPDTDRVWVCGDIVNRGPDSLQALRLVKQLGSSAITVLGNHDLHLLSVSEKIRRSRAGDTVKPILKAPDRDELLHWLRHQPLVHADKEIKTMMVHAGVYPGWSRKQVQKYAGEVQVVLQGKDYRELLKNMYGRKPVKWSESLTGWERYRFIINSLTRMRYCDKKANLNFTQKGRPGSQPKRLYPWYEHPEMKCQSWRIVFGHWSSLGYFQNRQLISLDSGCVWGGKLTAVRFDLAAHAPCWQLNCPSWSC